MNTLYLCLPSAAAVKTTSLDPSLTCSFFLAGNQGAITRSGDAHLSSLAATIASVDRVVLLLAASDVTLLETTAPPLSDRRLKLALPSLVEEHILDDPEDCTIVTSPLVDGRLPLAIMRRDRLQAFTTIFWMLGAKKLLAWPAQSGLPPLLPQDACIAALHEHVGEVSGCTLDICVYFPDQKSMGFSLHASSAETAVTEVLRTLRQLIPMGALTLLVPSPRVSAYAQAADTDTVVQADDWNVRIKQAAEAARSDSHNVPNMISAVQTKRHHGKLLKWRRPLQLAAGILLLNTVALNADWWRLHSESTQLKAEMLQTYRTRFPDERVILDPLLQMQQKIVIARRAAGEPVPDDFAALAANFAVAWNSLPVDVKTAITSLDYRERTLFVGFKSQTGESQADGFEQQLQSALALQKLVMQEAKADTWQIRRAP